MKLSRVFKALPAPTALVLAALTAGCSTSRIQMGDTYGPQAQPAPAQTQQPHDLKNIPQEPEVVYAQPSQAQQPYPQQQYQPRGSYSQVQPQGLPSQMNICPPAIKRDWKIYTGCYNDGGTLRWGRYRIVRIQQPNCHVVSQIEPVQGRPFSLFGTLTCPISAGAGLQAQIQMRMPEDYRRRGRGWRPLRNGY